MEPQEVAEMPMTESSVHAVSEESEPEQPQVIGGYNPDDGSANLVGTLHVHTEPFHDDYVTVASITLDEPFDYVSTYKGESYTVTAHEVFVLRDGMDDYDSWLPLDGQHITVHCESVNEAYHDASFFNVDTMAYGTSLLDVA